VGATGGFPTPSNPAVANGLVYAGSEVADLYAFDAAGVTNCSGTPKTCAPVWTGATGSGFVESPAVANGTVYVGSGDSNLYAFSLP
jgi:outer membrane protein assembly factor BamB